ncbi:hypothetical protein V5F89_02120 [Pelagerythrobacter marensis]|uniref:Secreted protein n=1 Tax=Pelagerythrobacter marensis TaxID=543877 RepID=A0ABZ2DBK5_9SPHN
MNANPFTNKWAAIALALLVIIAAIALVGDEEGEGVLSRLTERAADQRARAGDRPVPAAELAPPPGLVSRPPAAPVPSFDENPDNGFDDAIEFFPDDALVDDAEGFDSPPMIVHEREPDGGAVFEAEGETAIVVPNDGGEGL